MMKHVFWSLPSEVRRFLIKTFREEFYDQLQRMRTEPDNLGYTLESFVQNRCIFVHIPKCAGVSVCECLFGSLAGGHLNVGKYQLVFSEREYREFFKFTFVRNPWGRLYSAFTFLKAGGFGDYDKRWAEKELGRYQDFDAFVKDWVCPENILTWNHFIPQHEFICINAGPPQVDFIGYMENIGSDFVTIQNKIGCGRPLEHLNKTSEGKKDYREFYTPQTRAIVADIYRRDIDLLGYDFDNASLPQLLEARKAL